MTDNNKTVVDAFDLPLSGPIYGGVTNAKMSFEVRDFGQPERTLVVRFWMDGKVYTAMAPWSEFTDEMDAMRSRMFAGSWDEALTQLTAGGGN